MCHQITCPPVSCADPSFIEGECCPVCSHCKYSSKEKEKDQDSLDLFILKPLLVGHKGQNEVKTGRGNQIYLCTRII